MPYERIGLVLVATRTPSRSPYPWPSRSLLFAKFIEGPPECHPIALCGDVKLGTTAAYIDKLVMPNEDDLTYYTAEAKRCRRLAQGADRRTAMALIQLAEEYEAKAQGSREAGSSTLS